MLQGVAGFGFGGWIGNRLAVYVSEAVFRRATLVLMTIAGLGAFVKAVTS
jgi:uncharacterized membrane protein YfcA